MRKINDILRSYASLSEGVFYSLLIKILIVSVSLVIVLSATGVIKFPFFPFSTQGKIYVDSPEVYTRERLVNDRYEQDYWLRQQLKALDESQNLLTGTFRQRISTGLAEQDSSTDPGSEQSSDSANRHAFNLYSISDGTTNGGEQGALPFDQEFRIRAAVRDSIRQLILENMLDDRHDLLGNSVFGLKFDTTVIPGTNTHKRAFVRVSLTTDALKPHAIGKADEKMARPPDIANHVAVYFESELAEILHNLENPLSSYYSLYSKWLEDIEFRLNAYVSDYCKAASDRQGGKQKETYRSIFVKALEDILGVNPRDARTLKEWGADEGKHMTSYYWTPAPWSNFLKIQAGKGQEACEDLTFNIEPVWDTIFITPYADEEGDLLNQISACHQKIRGTDNNENISVFNPYGKSLTVEQFEDLVPKYRITSGLIEYARLNEKVEEISLHCPNAKGQQIDAEFLSLPSGFFQFIDNISKRDAYTYAVFPKTDVIGILTDISLSSEISKNDAFSSNAWLNFIRELRRSTVSTVLIGYGNGDRQEDGSVEFGWVIDSDTNMEPTQKSQTALISVPAWTEELQLTITTGWLDRYSNEGKIQTVETVVPVPPDFEAFDSFVLGGQVRRQPKILDKFLDQRLEVRACEPARLLIPGFRLWRSTAVTLGAQKADRITVLPNMRGLIADFNTVDKPSVTKGEDNNWKVKLRVWTSEGTAIVKNDVVILKPDNNLCSKNRADLQ